MGLCSALIKLSYLSLTYTHSHSPTLPGSGVTKANNLVPADKQPWYSQVRETHQIQRLPCVTLSLGVRCCAKHSTYIKIIMLFHLNMSSFSEEKPKTKINSLSKIMKSVSENLHRRETQWMGCIGETFRQNMSYLTSGTSSWRDYPFTTSELRECW